jgi:hypothetical protein
LARSGAREFSPWLVAGKRNGWFGRMNRRSGMPGTNMSRAEVSGISRNGIRLLLDGEDELFVRFSKFPWFRKAAVEQIFHVERPQSHHLYWPELDIDLDVESIRHPERFLLISRQMP